MFNNLRRFVDKIKPNFVAGGKFAWLQSTFEAFETFAFTPNRVTKRGSHVRDAIDLKRAMIMVVIALVPAMLFGMWNIGYQTSLHATDWPYELGTVASWWYCLWFGFLRIFAPRHGLALRVGHSGQLVVLSLVWLLENAAHVGSVVYRWFGHRIHLRADTSP